MTNTPERVQHLVEACRNLERGQGLFLLTDRATLSRHPDLHTLPFQSGHAGKVATLLD